MTIMPIVSPFIVDPDHRVILDEEAFMDEVLPDGPEYIAAAEIEPLLKTLFQRSL